MKLINQKCLFSLHCAHWFGGKSSRLKFWLLWVQCELCGAEEKGAAWAGGTLGGFFHLLPSLPCVPAVCGEEYWWNQMELDAHLTFFGCVSPCGIIFILQQYKDVTSKKNLRVLLCFYWAVCWEITRSNPGLFCQFIWVRHSNKLFIHRKNILWIRPHVVVKDNMAPQQECFSLLCLLNPQGDNYTLLLQEAFPPLKFLYFLS